VPSIMCQAASVSSCPCFLSSWPISLHIPHFPQCHLTTLHRHHTPMRTMKWLVACTRALESVLGYATSHFRDYLFKLALFLGDLAPLTHITHTHTHTHTHKHTHMCMHAHVFPCAHHVRCVFTCASCSRAHVPTPLPHLECFIPQSPRHRSPPHGVP
jgi:hypothetical protein